MKRLACALVLLGSLPFLGCTGASVETSDAQESTGEATAAQKYIQILDYWQTAADQDQWLEIRRRLVAAFDDRCGDTWCESDYTNLSSLGFDCSVDIKKGTVKECKWTLAGSSHLINPKTGTVSTDVPRWECKFTPTGTAKALSNTLYASQQGLEATLPGMNKTIYETLSDCFNTGAIGHTTIPNYSYGDNDVYVDVGNDPSQVGLDWETWFAARDKMNRAFDDVCGDTFCSGDYSNLTSLRFVCSASKTSGALKQCKRIFAGSYNTITQSTGRLAVHAKVYQCKLPLYTTAKKFVETIAAPTNDAIRTPIPGGTQTLYDMLLNCL